MPSDTRASFSDVSLEFAQRLFPNEPAVIADVFDAMQLGVLCNRTPPTVTSDTRRRHVREGISLASNVNDESLVFVDAVRGDDDHGDGTIGQPFRTVHRGVAAARRFMSTQRRSKATVVLRGGKHYLGRPLVLGPEDRGLTLTSVAGEEAVVSGGTSISGLTWRKAGAPLPDGVYVTDLPSNPNTTSFDALFVGERLEIRARWPNG